MKALLTSILVAFSLISTSCSLFKPYHMDIEQGKELKSATIEQVKQGMTKTEVINLLGEPLVNNAFDADRLDYVYTNQKNGGTIYQSKLTLILNNNKVVKIIKEDYPKK